MNKLDSESILELREIFNQMKDSRRHLRPILTDIASSIDKGIFIDAGSEEVTNLLKQILDAQEQFSTVEQVKKAANTKRLDQLEKTISTLEQNSKRNEIISTLEKLKTLELNSDNAAFLDAVKKIQLQAEYIVRKSDKWDMSHFAKEAERFLLLAEVIENIDNFSPEDFLKVNSAFSDTPLIAMALTSRVVHFPREEEEETFSAEEEETATAENIEESAKMSQTEPNIYRVRETVKKFDKVKPPQDLITAEDEDFKIEKAQVKKLLTIKSFNKKLHELLESTDPVAMFKILIRSRVMFPTYPKNLNLEDRFNKKLAVLVPTLLERLFNWGVVDKVSWRGVSFYFLNVTGLDLALRAFTNNPSPVAPEDYFYAMKKSLQLSLSIMTEGAIGKNVHFKYMKSIPLGRAEILPENPEDKLQLIFTFSLILLGDDWSHDITKFKMVFENELDAKFEIKAIFLFALSKNDLSWLKMFDTVKYRKLNLKFFLYTLDGLFDMEGKETSFDEVKKICKIKTPPEPPKNFLPDKKNSQKEILKAAQRLEFLQAKAAQLKNTKLKLQEKLAELENASKVEESAEDDAEDDFTAEEPIQDNLFDEVEENFETEDDENFSEVEVEEADEVEEIEEVDEVETIAVDEIVAGKFSASEVEKIIFDAEVEEKIAEVEVVEEPEILQDIKSESEINSLSNITNLFKLGATGRAMLSLHAVSDFISQTEPDAENWAEYLSREVGFILDDNVTLQNLNNFDTFSFWTGEIEIPDANIGNSFDYLNLAAIIKSFYAPQNPASYQLQKSWNQINEDKSNTALKSLPAAKNLISIFNSFTDKTHQAFADCLFNAEGDGEDKLNAAKMQLKNVENVVENLLHGEVNHPHVKDLIQQLFTNNGIVKKYLNVENFKSAEILNFCSKFEKNDLKEIFWDKNAVLSENIFSENKIGDFLDEVWSKPVIHIPRGKKEPFKGPKRKKVTSVMKQVLFALFNFIYAEKNLEVSAKTATQAAAPVAKAQEILSDLKKQISRLDKKSNFGQIIFNAFVNNLEKKLSGETVTISYTDCLLGAKYIELENNLPVSENFGVQEFSLKNRVAEFEIDIRYKKVDDNLQKAYETALKNYDCGVLQNLEKFFLSQLKISEEDIKRKISGLEKNVDRQIEKIANDFLNDLELARNYSRITDQEKIDFYINAAVTAKNHFLQTKNAGIFQRFIDACNSSINKVSIPQRNALSKRLENLEENLETQLEEGETLHGRYPVLAEVRRQIELMNLTVAEDYLNRLESDEGGTFLTELDVTDSNLKTLEDFLSEYEILLHALTNANQSVEGAFKQRARLHHTNRVNRETQDALDFTRSWAGIHSGASAAIETSALEILKHLGYGEGRITAKNFDSPNQKSYTVQFTKPVKVRKSYPHPFAAFGTEIYSKGLEVIFLGANRKYENVAQVLSEMTVDRSVICLMDSAMTLPERRSLAKIMKLTPDYKNVIVIDKVMALYLAKFDAANRGKRMLQIALPFARVQPYQEKGQVAPEMFIGRSEELDQIRDMSGPVFVYGGRQLGKSALLRQVESIEHIPSQLNYAFFIDLKNLNCEDTLKRIVYELQNAKLIGEVHTWQEFSFEMHKLLDGNLRGVYKPKKLLILLDESDAFLSDKDSGKAIDILRELLVAFNGQFKFILAGLHKVIRFEQNSGFGNLRHISVLPFRPSDAMELLGKPMSYLGFRIADDSLISAIFSRTNYYPGSIQYYCKMLVDAVGNNYIKQKFDVAKNPPYTLDDDYLKNMLGNREFQKEINDKFDMTLNVEEDGDNYYEIIALAVAMVYYEHNRPVGVSVSDIRNTCLMCGVEKITNLSDAELLSLLDEMVALNLLRRSDGKFEFNRYAFWHMMGTETEVNNKLDSYGMKA